MGLQKTLKFPSFQRGKITCQIPRFVIEKKNVSVVQGLRIPWICRDIRFDRMFWENIKSSLSWSSRGPKTVSSFWPAKVVFMKMSLSQRHLSSSSITYYFPHYIHTYSIFLTNRFHWFILLFFFRFYISRNFQVAFATSCLHSHHFHYFEIIIWFLSWTVLISNKHSYSGQVWKFLSLLGTLWIRSANCLNQAA